MASESIANMDSKLREQVWTVAGRVEWTEEDWRDFYDSLTAVFTRIAARHAREKIKEASAVRQTRTLP
jgi:hypothetical protein